MVVPPTCVPPTRRSAEGATRELFRQAPQATGRPGAVELRHDTTASRTVISPGNQPLKKLRSARAVIQRTNIRGLDRVARRQRTDGERQARRRVRP